MYQVNKGVDRSPEVMGIKGMNNLTYLAAAAVGLLLLTMLLIVVLPINSTILFIGYLVSVFLAYGYLVRLSRTHGERGMIRKQARSRRPNVVLVHNSEAYRALHWKRR